ncbi:MAG: hypothetical protein WCS96_13105 [Victivallales bacterium]
MTIDQSTIFEAVMLVCFGVAWPFSIWRTWKTKAARGKSMWFLCIVLTGYVSGVIHKTLNCLDYVIILYVMNAILVSVDMALTLKYRDN